MFNQLLASPEILSFLIGVALFSAIWCGAIVFRFSEDCEYVRSGDDLIRKRVVIGYWVLTVLIFLIGLLAGLGAVMGLIALF